ncbi:nucleolar GTP-binding protein 2-like [Amphibalanus amphitrite]|uniref:nucleolar GTP-binding protein 2-like n=1 Tax=Amphibalanus amphitrite TaxID=1232801 RepID=UPI001C8FB3A4|nr:nucleolar GTP-binding protein 2-like [Amphibalanus amphitrite]XP_043234331.1 nucleolar GTP-binding protein 2-like [Amphibalanus amphitrite]
MAKTKKRAQSRIKSKPSGFNPAGHSMNPDREQGKVDLRGAPFARDRSTIKRLQMYRNQKAKRDKHGKILRPMPFQSKLSPGSVARVEPNQRWFGNTKVISQNALQRFQEELGAAQKDPYQVVMKQNKLPVTLLSERAKTQRVHLLDTESFDSVFGPKRTRKRPKVPTGDLESYAQRVADTQEKYEPEKDRDLVRDAPDVREGQRDWVMAAGQSKRIWNELYKVIDSSDVVVQVLDARDPMGTRSEYVEKYLKKEKAHKHLIFVLNKVDLVPTWVTQKWVALLSQEYPTMAFHASLTNSFGKGALINLLRQFGKLHSDKKQISVGFIGYPNVGKSSVINTIKTKKVCKVAPIAGETKVWQYIALMKRIYLIDCPGVVYPSGETDTEKVLKGVVRVELISSPEDYVPAVLERVRPEYMRRTYGVGSWTDCEDFLERIAKRTGKLLKGGGPDVNTVSKQILNDFQRGRIPYFVPPPGCGTAKQADEAAAAASETAESAAAGSSEPQPGSSDAAAADEGADESEGGAVTTGAITAVSQDLSRVRTDLEFEGDDDQPLQQEGELYVSDGEQDEDESDADDETMQVETRPAADATPKNKRKAAGKKRKLEDDDGEEGKKQKKTAKQRRKEERDKKTKKIGSNFYDVVNVKNKNRNRIKPKSPNVTPGKRNQGKTQGKKGKRTP